MKRTHSSTMQYVEKHYVASLLLVIAAVLVLGGSIAYPSVHILRANNAALEQVRAGNLQEAQRILASVTQDHPLRLVTEQNRAVLAYKRNAYKESAKILEEAIHSYCTHAPQREYCGTAFYNLGNAYYRIGEHASSTRETLWMKAIRAYQKDIALVGADSWAQENIDFILQKLNASSTPQKEQKESASKENGENKNNASARKEDTGTGNNKEQTKDDNSGDGGSGGEGKQSSDNADEQNKEGNDGGTSSDKNGSQTGTQSDSQEDVSGQAGQGGDTQEGSAQNATTELDPRMNARLEAYMEQLEQQGRELQPYFSRNPRATRSRTQQGPFDDPFFQAFFGDSPFEFQGSNGVQQPEHDW